MSTGITKTRGPLTFVEMIVGKFKKDFVHVMQTVTTNYPSGRGGNSMSSALFADDKFGVGQSFDSERHCLIPAPKGATAKQAQALLAKLPTACIYRVLSYNVEDVLTEEQKDFSQKTLDEYREDLVVKDANTDEPILIGGKPQYRQLFFSDVAREDIDFRNVTRSIAAPAAVASEVVEELAG